VIGKGRRRWDVVEPGLGVHRWPRPRSCAFVLAAGGPDDRRDAEAFADHLARAAVDVDVLAPGATAGRAAANADLVLLQGVSGHPGTAGIAAARAGRPTVLLLARSDLDGAGQLAPSAVALAEACGLVAAPTAAALALVRATVTARPVRSVLLPPLVARSRFEALDRARTTFGGGGAEVVAWAPEAAGGPTPADRAVEEALTAALEQRPDLHVDLVRGGDRLDSSRVRRIRNDLQPHSGARWTCLLASGAPGGLLRDEPPLLAEAGLLGVPALVPAGPWALGAGRLAVADPERAGSWLTALVDLLDDAPARERLAYAAGAGAAALHGRSASDAVVHRFLGWVDGGRR
jgi:hypothetical protein